MCAIVKTCHNFQKAYHLLRMWCVLSPYRRKGTIFFQPFKSSKWAESIDQQDFGKSKRFPIHQKKRFPKKMVKNHVSHPPCRRRVAANPIPSQPPRWSCNWRPEPRTAWCRATWPQRTEDGTWVKMASIFLDPFHPTAEKSQNVKMSNFTDRVSDCRLLCSEISTLSDPMLGLKASTWTTSKRWKAYNATAEKSSEISIIDSAVHVSSRLVVITRKAEHAQIP